MTPMQHPTFIPATGPIAWRQSTLPARSARRPLAVTPAPRCAGVSPQPSTRAAPVPAPARLCEPAGLSERLASRAASDTAVLARGVRDAALVLFAAAVLATGGGVTGSDAGMSALADVPTSAPSVGVFDDAGLVGKSNEELFSRAAASMEKRTGVHVRFVLAQSLPYGVSPSEYATQLAGDWGLGGSDVLFVASPKLARAGVFVGGEVQSLLPEETARSVAEETYALPAGAERYGAALLGVSNRLIPLLNGEADPGPPSQEEVEGSATYKTKEETTTDRGKYIKIVGGVLVIAFIAPLVQTYWYVRND